MSLAQTYKTLLPQIIRYALVPGSGMNVEADRMFHNIWLRYRRQLRSATRIRWGRTTGTGRCSNSVATLEGCQKLKKHIAYQSNPFS